MKITKAVIPAAGLGTRVLPASKAIPKEMLPIVDKPAIQYIVEEAVAAGITDILIITGRGKGAIEDHFDRAPELEDRLLKGEKNALYDECIKCSSLANIQYVRQKETKGLGHAVLCAKSFVGNDPFVVMYGDDVILGDTPATAELCTVYEQTGRCVLGVKEVPLSEMHKYGSIKFSYDEAHNMIVSDMNEKPKPGEALSSFAILGRVVLTPEIFPVLEQTTPGAGGEIQLTDAMKVLAHRDKMAAKEYSGTRYDMGNKLGIIEATLAAGLSRDDLKDDLKVLLTDIVAKF
ncbi:MAG: UTP--glucose-1-phosphate uridylyltransferase GalU [Candidatus Fimivivens sp.]|nr:UTP--glucose-1-phosphate uridylyltransferase GalU [Candidatus Fimivivens sp.]